MKKTFIASLLFISLFSISFNGASQQSYKSSFGLRGGSPSGITGKHFLTNNIAVEGIFSFGWWGGFGATALYQIHNPLNLEGLPGFKWYYGLGAHLATSNQDRQSPWANTTGGTFFLGADGVFGVEYVFAEAPISIGLDVLPILNIIDKVDVWFNAGLSVRYTIK
ncbi:MAG: hypothetical protein ACLFNU_11715 [Bacteroidales bacterium]